MWCNANTCTTKTEVLDVWKDVWSVYDILEDLTKSNRWHHGLQVKLFNQRHLPRHYFGPTYIRQGRDRVKVGVCLFTSITVWAIHLELVEDRTTEQFLSALRRFIAWRGKPDQIILDNAPHFKATKNAVDMA